MKYFPVIGKTSLWLYLMATCLAALLKVRGLDKGLPVWLNLSSWQTYSHWLLTPRGFFFLAMLPLVILTMWELRDLDQVLSEEEDGEIAR